MLNNDSEYVTVEPCGCIDSLGNEFEWHCLDEGIYIECLRCGAVWDEPTDQDWLDHVSVDECEWFA